MNIEYNKFNMFFKYKGLNEIKSPPNLAIREFPSCNTAVAPDPHGYGVIDRCEIGEFYFFAENNGYNDPNAFNIYIPYGTRQFAGASRFNDTKFIIRADIASAGGMVHEMGHSFYLKHTFNNYNNASCERVTRDPNDINFNADTKGDQVVDTAAVPDFAKEYCYTNPLDINCIDDPKYMSHVYIDDNCEYIGNSVNFYDEFFEINPSDIQNYMAYTVASCRNQFTIGQGIRARETIRDDTFNNFAPAMTTISALY
ncbi:hypothetical protein [Patiriisocius marinus]|uniref:hypothetical protein n=1 Tax=Patiriisocius marinus TaxID=1397112 RepID=UPI00232DAF59|nr:hypothetical protein [Patiriisocius marinus]